MATRKRTNSNAEDGAPPAKKAQLNSGEEQPKKPRKKSVTAKSLGLTKDEFNSIKSPVYKKELKQLVKQLNSQVDDDWHDGYEEQGETIVEWCEYLKKPLQAIIDIGIKKLVGFEQCHNLLKVIEESHRDLCACPMRGTVNITEYDVNYDLSHPKLTDLSQYPWRDVWVLLVMSHANEGDVPDEVMLQAVKNLQDCDALGEIEEIEGMNEKESPFYKLVHDRADEWKGLPDNLRTFRTRRAIDRRYDGTPERRTRDFGSDEEGGGWGFF